MPIRSDSYQYPISRYKCMFVFTRTFIDPLNRKVIGKTTCCRPIGHSGKHMNVRGEAPDGEILNVVEIRKFDDAHRKDYMKE